MDQDWLNKRYDMEHLEKWIQSGVPMSVLTSNGWISQFQRMVRYIERAKLAKDEVDILDFSIAFFQACYHLREWIQVFEQINRREWLIHWEAFLKKHICMKYCRDLCNISKHMIINKSSITPNIVITRDYVDDGSELGLFRSWILHIDNKKIELNQLMDDCIEAWRDFINNDIFNLLGLNKYLK